MQQKPQKNIKFSSKIDPNLSKNAKHGRTVPTINTNVASRTAFSAKDRFSVDFWAPAGSQKEPKSRQGWVKLYLRLPSVPHKIPPRSIFGTLTPQLRKKMRTGASKMGPGAVRNAKNSPRTGHTTDANHKTPEAKRGAAVLPPGGFQLIITNN